MAATVTCTDSNDRRGASASSPMCIDDQLLGLPLVDSGTQVYNWSDEQLEIIAEHRQYIKDMEMFLKDIEITGPDGKKIPKKPKTDIATLLNNNRKTSDKLSGVKLNDYLQKNITDAVFIHLPSVSEVNPKTLNDALKHLKTGYESLRESNKRNLCVSLDYGMWLNKAFALFSVENMGNAVTWKEWIAKEIGIQDRYARKLRKVATALGQYTRFRDLALSFSEVYTRLKEIECMLASDNEIAEYWKHSSTSVDPVPTSDPTRPSVGDLRKSGAPGKVRLKHGAQYRSNPYMRKHK